MAEGKFFEELMKENKEYVKAFSENKEFQKYLVALFVMANDEAHRLKCDIEDLEVENPTISPDRKNISFGFTKKEKPKPSGLVDVLGNEILSEN